MYNVILSRQAVKDLAKLKRAGASYARKAKELAEIVAKNPFQNPPSYEKLVGDLAGYYSRRINAQHRFAYDVKPGEDEIYVVHVLRMWTHYE